MGGDLDEVFQDDIIVIVCIISMQGWRDGLDAENDLVQERQRRKSLAVCEEKEGAASRLFQGVHNHRQKRIAHRLRSHDDDLLQRQRVEEFVELMKRQKAVRPFTLVAMVIDPEAGFGKVAVKSLLFKKAWPAAQIASPEEKTTYTVFPGVGYMVDICPR